MWLKMRHGFNNKTFNRSGRSILGAGTAVKRPVLSSKPSIVATSASAASAGYVR
jgi:hypothetical protein